MRQSASAVSRSLSVHVHNVELEPSKRGSLSMFPDTYTVQLTVVSSGHCAISPLNIFLDNDGIRTCTTRCSLNPTV